MQSTHTQAKRRGQQRGRQSAVDLRLASVELSYYLLKSHGISTANHLPRTPQNIMVHP